MARCDLPLYKNVLPKIKVTQLTSNQMKRLSNLDKEKKQFFMNERLYADDAEKDLMEGWAAIFGKRLESKTNVGIDMGTFTNEAYQKGLKAAEEAGLGNDALALGEEILLRTTKGAPLTHEQRALALPAFLKRFEAQPLLNRQYLQAYNSGDEDMTARFGAEIAKSIAVLAGVRADQNALSVALNTYKYMYKQIQENAKIMKLFQNGDC